MSVPSRKKRPDLSTEEGREQLLALLVEADEEVAKFIHDTAERERKAREGILKGTSPCAHISV